MIMILSKVDVFLSISSKAGEKTVKPIQFEFEVLEAITIALIVLFFGPAFCYAYLSMISLETIFNGLIALANLGLAYVAFAASGDWKKKIELEKSMELRSVARMGKEYAQFARRYGAQLATWIEENGATLIHSNHNHNEFDQKCEKVQVHCRSLIDLLAPHLIRGNISGFAVERLRDGITLVDIVIEQIKSNKNLMSAKANAEVISPNLVKVIEIFDEISERGDVKYEFSEFRKKEELRKNSN